MIANIRRITETVGLYPPKLAFGIAVSLILAIACAEPSAGPVPVSGPTLSLAKSVSTTDMTVTSAVPDSATQDTTLDVVINGSGFVAGTSAKWALAGIQDFTQVRTNSTRYVNSRQIIASITISKTATIAKWDVQVAAVGKKGGIGTEAFAIKLKPYVDVDSRVNLVFESSVNVAAPGAPVVMAPAGVQGDSRDKYGAPSASSEYQGAFCGVNGKIFWYSGSATSGDMVFDADMDWGHATACGARRALKFYLSYQPGGSPGAATSVGTFSNVRQVMQMAAGEVISRKFHYNYLGIANCTRLDFDEMWAGASNIRVTRLPDGSAGRRWYVESQYPHMAMCTESRGSTYSGTGLKYLPFAFTITEIPFPYPSNP
jgi:hypothetical protein